jgi:hypothetical protein
LWVELIPIHLERDLPPAGVHEIGYHTPLTPTDALLMLVGAESWLTSWEMWDGWVSDELWVWKDDHFMPGPAALAMFVAGDQCRLAMYHIRKEQLDAYLLPARHIGGPLP